MSNPPRIDDRARPAVESLARFWQFKRKKLALELQDHLEDAQRQLDTLFNNHQALATLSASQSDSIHALSQRNDTLTEALQVETGKLASTTKALEQETAKLQKAMLALAQAKVYTKELEERQAQALATASGLEQDLVAHKQLLADKEQHILDLEQTLANVRQQLEALESLKQALTAQCAEQAEQIGDLQTRKQALTDALQAKTAEAEDLAQREAQALDEIANLEKRLAKLNRELTAKEADVTELERTMAEVQKHLEEVKDANLSLTEQCAGQATHISELVAHNASLSTQLHTEQANVAELEERRGQALAQISELETYLDEHKAQLSAQEQNVELLESFTEELKASKQHLENHYADINQQHLSLTEKFSLVSRVLAQQPPVNEELDRFAELINNDYMAFAVRESSLAGEAQAVLDMQAILAELRMLNNFPSIAGKTILSIAGGFSSGKSAFINSFIKDSSVRLATGINPVTVVPSYVVCSEETRFNGYSYNGGAIDLEPSLYASMSHEYVKGFGFDLRRILPFISVKVPMDPQLFGNLCIIDTPGYNPGTSGGASAADRSTAASLVNQASALVWVIGLDPAGTIDQSDIEFIESTPFRGNSLYIVLNKADVKSDDDIDQIMEQVADDLAFAEIEYAGMCAYSSTARKRTYPSTGLAFEQFLRSINCKVDVVGKISNKLDAVFDAYKCAIKADIAQLKGRKNEFNAFKLDALEIGGTALHDRIERAFPLSEQMFDVSELEQLVGDCEDLRHKLKLAAQKALRGADQAHSKSAETEEFLRLRIRR
ncbi:dynamin family protein [Pseudomonas sp. NPDC089422]|uniref:dynamin family protein n=1 Tax=Pseudomonas sp. NPDC089422 TaxID=3364466 RepID=UPI003825F63D